MAKKRYGDRYDAYTSSFSGSDCIVSLVFPAAAPVIVGTATTITYSIYRQLAQVRTLGRISSKGRARGGVTYAGTIIFTIINESFIEDVRSRVDYLGKFKRLRPDELPPFDIVMTFGNEFGQSSSIVIYGASFTDETKTISVEDIFTENVFTFLANDVQHMKNEKNKLDYQRSGTFRGNDEVLGKFALADLIATQEDKDRKARLAELARKEKARWEEPVLTDPATIPSDTSGGNYDSGGSSGGSGGGNAPVTGTPGQGMYGKLKLRVYASTSSGSRTALSGATVYYDDAMNGGRHSAKTDANGWVSFVPTYDKKFKYVATKSGYSTSSKEILLKKSEGTKEDSFVLNKITQSGPGGDPGGKNVVYTTYNGPDKYKISTYSNQTIGKIWAKGDGPRLKLTNASNGAMTSVPVEFKYVIHNYDKCPWYKKIPFKLAWSSAKGGLGMGYTDSSGNVSLPVFALNDLFDGAIIQITAEPFLNKNISDGKVSKSLWKSWYFKKDN